MRCTPFSTQSARISLALSPRAYTPPDTNKPSHASYIKGLFEGYELDKSSKEGRIISELITLVCDMSDKINALEADNKELHEYVEELDHDLGEVEEEVYFYDDDEYDDYDDLNDFDDEEYDRELTDEEIEDYELEEIINDGE